MPDWKRSARWSERISRTWFIPARLIAPRSSAGYGSWLGIRPLSQVKSRYAHTNFDPNRVTQFLIATLAGLHVPFVCSETHELGEELVGSYLYQVHLYDWLESNDHGRYLSDNDI